MIPGDLATPATTNRSAIISLVAGLLTLASACLGMIPVPLTGFVCFPASAILGLVALVTGLRGIRQMRSSGERGRGLAAVGVGLGTAGLLGALCIVIGGIAVWTRVAETVHLVPP